MPQLLLNCQGSLGLRSPTKPPNLPVLPDSHFGTNDPVQEYQIPAIRTFLRQMRARKSRLDDKIASLEATLRDLYSERDALDADIHNHAAALSPIRRMPTEILSLIFTYALANDSEFHYQVDSAPWTLSAVCTRWRSVALSPIFWTKISNWGRHFSLEKLEIVLSRSASLPLQIYFHTDNEEAIADIETITLELLLQHCQRWELLCINGSPEIYSIMESFGSSMPNLRTLEFDIYYTDGLPAPHELDLFSHLPKLEKVSVNAGCWSYPFILALPWRQLSAYYASSEWDGLSALASAVNLVECTLDMGGGREPADKDVVVMQFPRLLRLSVSHRGVLAYLDTPVLQELYYHDDDPAQPVSDLDFFRTLPRALEQLVFDGFIDTSSDLDFVGIMKALPRTLRSFAFSISLSADLLCEFLASAAEKAPLLERVAAIVPENSELRILDRLEALDWSNRLRGVDFIFAPRPLMTSDVLRRLQVLHLRGVDVHFTRYLYSNVVPERFQLKNR